MVFSQIMYHIVPYARDLLPVKFFLSVTLKNFASNYLKMYREPIKWPTWLVPEQAYAG